MSSCPVFLRSALPRLSASLQQTLVFAPVRAISVATTDRRPSLLRCADGGYISCRSGRCGIHQLRFASSVYKSAYSIDKIYPGSAAIDIANLVHHEYAKQYSVEAREKFTGYIPSNALEIRSMRSSGPGGQSVNTSNSKVEVRFNVELADWIPLWIKKQFIEDQKHRINKRNEFVISSEKTRTQLLNQADCLDRIRHYIRESEVKATPKEVDPEEEELKKKKADKANERRLLEKKRHSLKKSGRGPL